jgi:hypothetical protein
VLRYKFPNASNTGVPAGVKLTTYTGPCNITAPNTVIDSKTVNCSLDIKATGVRIVNSKVNGSLSTSAGGSATVEDTEIEIGSPYRRGINGPNWIVRRVNIHGGYSGAWCTNCTVEFSYIHDQDRDNNGQQHASAIRMSQGLTLRGNTILCNAPIVPPDAGCSADLTGYGDFDVVQDSLIIGNLFKATSVASFCTYGGSSPGKPYSSQTNHVRFIKNIFERGSNGKCGYYGPVGHFDRSRPGNKWRGNKWDDGTPVAPEF